MIRIMCVLIITAIDTCNEFLFWISGVLPVWLFFLDTCKIRIKKTLSSVTKFFVTKNHVSAWMEKGKNIIDIKNSRKLMLFQPTSVSDEAFLMICCFDRGYVVSRANADKVAADKVTLPVYLNAPRSHLLFTSDFKTEGEELSRMWD